MGELVSPFFFIIIVATTAFLKTLVLTVALIALLFLELRLELRMKREAFINRVRQLLTFLLKTVRAICS